MNDSPCTAESQFLCEFNPDPALRSDKQMDFSRILLPLIELETNLRKKQLFMGSGQVTWINALQICTHFGFDLLMPESFDDHEQLITTISRLQRVLETESGYFAVHIGVTSHGVGKSWYSINNGKILDSELDYMKLPDNRFSSSEYDSSKSEFVRFKLNERQKSTYDALSGMDHKHFFICQRTFGLSMNIRDFQI